MPIGPGPQEGPRPAKQGAAAEATTASQEALDQPESQVQAPENCTGDDTRTKASEHIDQQEHEEAWDIGAESRQQSTTNSASYFLIFEREAMTEEHD